MPKAASSLKTFRAKSALTKRQENDSRHQMMIKSTMMGNRLIEFALAKPTDDDFEEKQMSAGQVNAAKVILDRTVPIVSPIQMLSDNDTETLSRDQLQEKIQHMLVNNPMLGVIAGITPKTIEGEAHDITEESDGDS